MFFVAFTLIVHTFMLCHKVIGFPVYVPECRNLALSANSHFVENVPLNRTRCIISRYLTNQLGGNNESTRRKQRIIRPKTTNCRRENNESTAGLANYPGKLSCISRQIIVLSRQVIAITCRDNFIKSFLGLFFRAERAFCLLTLFPYIFL
jgi:hypothetical protein